MLSRELNIVALGGGRVRFELNAAGDVPESQIVSELTEILIAVEPALDSESGRLAPGRLSSEVAMNLFLTAPDASGISHIAGLECPEPYAETVSRLVEGKGYRVRRSA